MAAAVPTSTKRTEKKIKPVSQNKHIFRSKDAMLSVLMWGINHSINEMASVKKPIMLMPDEFKAYSKIRIDNHMFNKDNMPSHYQFKELCPLVFRNLRERFGIDETSYLNSLTKHCPVDIASPGRSGARFLTSLDRKYIIKSLSADEVAKMNRILRDYHQHIVECHAKTLLPQYFGLYRIRLNENDPVYFIVMRNIFSPRFVVHKKYDLKGSSVDRKASDKERAKEFPTFKDNDFINDKVIIHLSQEDRASFFTMLEADASFLASLNLMDYSLLVGIHDGRRDDRPLLGDELSDSEEYELDNDELGEQEEGGFLGTSPPPDSPLQPSRGYRPPPELDPAQDVYGIRSSDRCPHLEIYFMALIDVLTDYGVNKRTAQLAKTVRHGTGAEISTVRPDQYARRFLDFIHKIIP